MSNQNRGNFYISIVPENFCLCNIFCKEVKRGNVRDDIITCLIFVVEFNKLMV